MAETPVNKGNFEIQFIWQICSSTYFNENLLEKNLILQEISYR